jgi:hypothetical protein
MENNMKELPIGISDFEKAITGNYYYIDKSLFIKEIIKYKAEVTLITRPRRFGKTLNLSMLKYFFEKTKLEESKKNLFKNLKIFDEAESMKHQGQYPVIFLTLKETKKSNWDECYDHVKILIAAEFSRHKYLLQTKTLDLYEEKNFNAILDGTANKARYENALLDLSQYLYRCNKIKPIILIDEYDTPINEGFTQGYYKEIINFMRGFLGAGLKDNPNLQFSVITGIMRIAKESIFSDLNNLEVCTFFNEFYSDKFGLLQEEVDKILEEYELKKSSIDVKNWYNGYKSGNFRVYNPWSIINFVKQRNLSTYWTYTSSNDVIKKLIQSGSADIKENLEKFLIGEKIEIEIIENIIFPEIEKRATVLWNFLFCTGYLTYQNRINKGGSPFAEFYIPNIEIRNCYETIIKGWIEEVTGKQYSVIANYLASGDVQNFSNKLSEFVLNSFSYFDKENNSEKSFQMFILGILSVLDYSHEIKSERESGYGRCDLILIPRDKNKLGIIIELKKSENEKDLEITAEKALQQIKEKKYEQEFISRNIKNVLKLGIAFNNKKVLIKRV